MVLSVVLALGLSNTLHAQGLVDGFMRGARQMDVALSYTGERYDEFYVGRDLVSTPAELGAVTTSSLSLFVAYGASDNMDIVVSLPYISASADGSAPPTDQSGLQDLAFAVKWRPWQAAWSKTGTFSLVTAAGVATPASNYVDMFPVAIGHRTTSFFGRVVGLAQWTNGLFADLRGGYSVCTGEAPNVAVGSVRAGYAARRVFAAAWIAGQLARGGTDIMEGSFRSNGVSYTRLGGQVYVPIVPSFGVYAGAATTLNGRNVGQSAQFSFGALFRSAL